MSTMIDIGDVWSTGGRLTIDGVLLHLAGAWNVTDVRELWLPAAVRGSDIIVPHAPGVLATRRRRTVTAIGLPFVVGGFADAEGNLICDAEAFDTEAIIIQFQQNIDYLRTNVLDPTDVTDGTRSASLDLPDGSTRTGAVHVLGVTVSRFWPTGLECTLDLSLPAGVLS